jgi:hypothetical protein
VPDAASIARVERNLEKLTDAIAKQGETLHAIQMEQALQKAGIDAIKKSMEYTSGLLANLRNEFDVVKDKVAQLDGEVFSEGGLKEHVKYLYDKATAGRTIWRTGGWIVGAIITFSVLVGAISVIVQQFVSPAPSATGAAILNKVETIDEKLDSKPAISVPVR